MTRRSLLVYGVLLALSLVIAGWQVAEHLRVREASRSAVISRARDISTTMALVMRSQRRFGVISRERLESALTELIRPGEVASIGLLNAEGDVVASAGGEFDLSRTDSLRSGVHWGPDSVTVFNLVDLGTNFTQEAEAPAPTIVLPREQLYTNYPPPPPRPSPVDSGTNLLTGVRPEGTNAALGPPRWRWPRGGTNSSGGTNRPSFSRPFWMSPTDYQAAIKKQGAHSIVIVMSAAPLHDIAAHDILLRTLICLLAVAAAGVSGFAWRNFVKTHELQLRLVKASEMNGHLKQMNLAAAGLAHETRNPLNIIRGLAQMISQQTAAAPEVREKSRAIVEETDRVTAQLNEFINYSRPREVRRSPVPLGRVVSEVARALTYDAEEKKVQVRLPADDVTIEADEQLLRQALFNLLINAIQAVDTGGQIEVVVIKNAGAEAVLEVRDDGPGVAPDQRAEIFKPYVTTHQKGTGLGLAVVQQIVAAHGWEIVCLGNQPKGAIFRISRLRPSRAA